MALPDRAYRKDIALMVAFNPQQPATFTTFCGATGVSFSLSNEIQSERVADCDDLEAAVAHAATFSWAASAERLRGVYRDTLASFVPGAGTRHPAGG